MCSVAHNTLSLNYFLVRFHPKFKNLLLDFAFLLNEFYPNDLEILNGVALAYHANDKLEAAFEQLEKILEIEPKNTAALVSFVEFK